MSDQPYTSLNLPRNSRVGAVFNQALERVLVRLAERRANKQRRAAFETLCHLDERTLEDIGVTREEVDWAAGLPLGTNASRAMYQKAGARRASE